MGEVERPQVALLLQFVLDAPQHIVDEHALFQAGLGEGPVVI